MTEEEYQEFYKKEFNFEAKEINELWHNTVDFDINKIDEFEAQFFELFNKVNKIYKYHLKINKEDIKNSKKTSETQKNKLYNFKRFKETIRQMHFNWQKDKDIYTILNDDNLDAYTLKACIISADENVRDLLSENPDLVEKVKKVFNDPKTVIEQENIQSLSKVKKGNNYEIRPYQTIYAPNFDKIKELLDIDNLVANSFTNLKKLSGEEVFDSLRGNEESEQKQSNGKTLESLLYDYYYHAKTEIKQIDRTNLSTSFNNIGCGLDDMFDIMENLDINSPLSKLYQERVADLATMNVITYPFDDIIEEIYQVPQKPTKVICERIEKLIENNPASPYLDYYYSQIPLLNRLDSGEAYFSKSKIFAELYKTTYKTYQDTNPKRVEEVYNQIKLEELKKADLLDIYLINGDEKVLNMAMEDTKEDKIYLYNRAYKANDEKLMQAVCYYIKKDKHYIEFDNRYIDKDVDYTRYNQAIKEARVMTFSLDFRDELDAEHKKMFYKELLSNNPNLYQLSTSLTFDNDTLKELITTNPKLKNLEIRKQIITSDDVLRTPTLEFLKVKSFTTPISEDTAAKSNLKILEVGELENYDENILKLPKLEKISLRTNNENINKIYEFLMDNKPENLEHITLNCDRFTDEQCKDLLQKHPYIYLMQTIDDDETRELNYAAKTIVDIKSNQRPMLAAVQRCKLFEYLEYLCQDGQRISIEEFNKDNVFGEFKNRYQKNYDDDFIKLSKYVDFGDAQNKESSLLNAIKENRLSEYIESLPKEDRPTFADLFKNNKFIKADSTPMDLIYESSNDNIRLTKSLVKTIELLDVDSSQLKQIEVSPDNDKSYALKNATKMILDKRNLALARQKQVEFSQQLRAKQGKE